MNIKDFIRLSKINLKERKKTTKATVRGITFGMVLLIPLFFVILAFYVDLNNSVNNNPEIRNFDIGVINNKSEEIYSNYLYSGYVDNLKNASGVNKALEVQTYKMVNDENNISFVIDNTNYNASSDVVIETFNDFNPTLSYEKNALLAGDYFTNEYGQIMVSSKFLEKYNFNYDIVGSSITISTMLINKDHITSSNEKVEDTFDDYESQNIYILKSYKIVGVFDSSIYKDSVRGNGIDEDVYFWLNSASIEAPQRVTFEKKGIGNYLFYVPYYYYNDNPVNLSNNAIRSNKVFIPIGFGVETNSKIDSRLILEMKDYKSADKLTSSIDKYLKLSSNNPEAYTGKIYMSSTFEGYQMFYRVFTYICLILAVFGGVVFLTNLLNLYNTIQYSVQSRMNYIGLMRAIGLKSKDVIKQYFIEILVIFKRSYIWSAIIGGLISLIIMLVFNLVMENYITSIAISLTLNPIFILAAFLILVVLNTLIALVFAYIAAHKAANKPILDTLINEK